MFENIFGIHERALYAAADRAGVLATNIANADTPNYKARDYDFAAILAGEGADASLTMARTHLGHLPAASAASAGGELKYRVPFQPALDGNTVEAPVEEAQFGQNAIRYQMSLDAISRQVAMLQLAITGQ
jgi:flagellar basal-body rod protein FlgB